MGAEFTFWDYLDDEKTNVVTDWYTRHGRNGYKVKAKFETRLLNLEATPKGEGLWLRPYADTLTGECDGLFEIRAELRKTQFRLLGFHHSGDSRDVTLVMGAVEREGRWEPPSACQQAQARKAKAEADPEGHRKKHFGDPAATDGQPRGSGLPPRVRR